MERLAQATIGQGIYDLVSFRGKFSVAAYDPTISRDPNSVEFDNFDAAKAHFEKVVLEALARLAV